jgi:uncharacterized phage-like protein YoqJ
MSAVKEETQRDLRDGMVEDKVVWMLVQGNMGEVVVVPQIFALEEPH